MNRLDALADPGLRRTLLLVRRCPQPVTAREVAERMQVPRTAARWRLERLVAAGLLLTRFERRSGRRGPGAGRPAKTYAAAPENAAIEFPRRRYETLVALLMNSLPLRGRSVKLREVGAAFGRELAAAAGLRRGGSLAGALERLCRGLGELGFQASVESVSTGGAAIVSATCPLRPLVAADPAARALDQGMWSGLVQAVAGRRYTGVSCETHGCLDPDAPCRICITWDA